METKSVLKDKFFIVIRGKSRKGFCRGCIGRVESELAHGELLGLLYGTGNNACSPKSGGVVRREDTYPLSRHQAQLLLFISSVSKRLEVLCNPQLFSAICELSHGDLVVVRHKKGHLPALVQNLMQIGRKDKQEDLHMLGFEVEFVDNDHSLPSKKVSPLPLFSAADIVQVVPSSSVPLGFYWKDGQCGDQTRKPVTRINSMPAVGSHGRHIRETPSESLSRSRPHLFLEVGSLVEVESNSGVTVYGVIRWLGVPEGRTGEWAGIELDYDISGCSDGTYRGSRYFICKGNKALFVPVSKCSPDSRFCSSAGTQNPPPTEVPPVLPCDDVDEEAAPPVSEADAVSLLVGRMKGIQGHINSCYLDATLFSLFSSSVTLDKICQTSADSQHPMTQNTLRKIINRLRRHGFVPAQNVMNFRKQLGCNTFRTEEKDPEEFITVLFQNVLCVEPLLKLRSKREASQGAYTFQIFLQKEQVGQVPTVQQLLDTSCVSCDLKFEEMPSCLIVQMPRFGNKYKMFSQIIPSMELDLTDLLSHSARECFICGRVAEYECPRCLPDPKLQPGRIKQFCSTCSTQVHTHPTRRSHIPQALEMPVGGASSAPTPTDTPTLTDAPTPTPRMQLFAVLCIQTSHYVSFVKYGPDRHSWMFFDSMADRSGDDQTGYNIPQIRACPELGDFLSQSEEELGRADPSQAPELVRRLLCDSYMFLYQTPAMVPWSSDQEQRNQNQNQNRTRTRTDLGQN